MCCIVLVNQLSETECVTIASFNVNVVYYNIAVIIVVMH